MAIPEDFNGSNVTLNPAQGDEHKVGQLKAFAGPEGMISRWKLTEIERKQVAETGDIWVQQRVYDRFVPIYISGLPLMEFRNADGSIAGIYDPDKKD
ncbi:hypothetical protein BAJUN_00320 [Bajunvirus bajun]|uniref:Uncharacterized protein n=1 Tax=Brevundimonas phage vB_BgoS-Bajun TaxID=2948594 RepID=A0A9E7SUQ3_9CAUD|nr:hypothetical protein BAJUN_00320 [Brevundimonas phage vB_BgoS-Bajun]